jgi:hypothetical protein
MGCLLALAAWLSPRFVMVLLQLFTDRLAIAFDSGWIGWFGFFFLPYTAVFYALCYKPLVGVSGFGWFVVALGFLIDIGAWGNGARSGNSRYRT